MNTNEILKNIADAREKLRVIRFTAAGARSKNVKESSALKKQIARSLTELRSRKNAA